MTDKARVMSIRLPGPLRARLDACAQAIGAMPPEFVRGAIRNECERVEKLHGQRERAHRKTDRDGAGDAA